MNINQILKQQTELIKPSKDTLKIIKKTGEEFCKSLVSMLRKKRIEAEVFVGGSLAKGTLTKKKKYDVDVFVRFNKKYKDNEISNMLGRILKGKVKRIHGSRDYYKIIVRGIIFEVIPVIKIKKPSEARNITDLSCFHVNYIKKKLKNKKLADEILLAKTFTHAQNCYGAESYIHGFSGYSLELLICHYGSFLNFIKEISSISVENSARKKSGSSLKSDKLQVNNRIIIDTDKKYKNNNEILRELNESKIQSPIILIDPTFKERNALAGLSEETFNRFRENCKKFLKNPDEKFFIQKNLREELSKKYGKSLKVIEVKTSKQAGDIAGSKSKKFFEFLVSKLEKEFIIKLKEFDYDNNKNSAYFYFVLKERKNIIIPGPPVTAVEHLVRFKKAHKDCFIKQGKAYAYKKEISFNKFMKDLKKDKTLKEMGITRVG